MTNSREQRLGDPLCPCLPLTDVNLTNDASQSFKQSFGEEFDFTYGIGCAQHDIETLECQDTDICLSSIVPHPRDCDRSWCDWEWCFVDPGNCNLQYKPSAYFDGRFYSYGACGYMDSFAGNELLGSLQGKTLRVAFNSNSGGFSGAYHPDGHFATTNKWNGPTAEFALLAAREGQFRMNITAPPAHLIPESERYFGPSPFDLCIYATALGHLDLCVSAYTITDKRAASVSWFVLQEAPLYLVVFNKADTTWESFFASFMTIFEPFKISTWALILFIVLPILGMLMLIHEYGSPGSAFPSSISVTVQNRDGTQVEKTKPIPITHHVTKSIYMSFLALFQRIYDPNIVTSGGMVNLLGISFFVVTTVAVYTANLAAILTVDRTTMKISTLKDAMASDLTFCCSRTTYDILSAMYDNQEEEIHAKFVPDPEDGLPGCACDNCSCRVHIFDSMKRNHNKDNKNDDKTSYCDAAISREEDLLSLQNYGDHCNKTIIKRPIATEQIGMPIYTELSKEITTLLFSLKNEGAFAKKLSGANRQSRCPNLEGEGNALSIDQLAGIWVVTFAFALVGLLVKCFQEPPIQKRIVDIRRKRLEDDGKHIKEIPTRRLDQWGADSGHFSSIDLTSTSERKYQPK